MQTSGDWSFSVDANGVHAVTGPNGVVHLRGMLQIGRQIERRAKELCPVDRGRLRSSIAARAEVEGNRPVVIVGTTVEYAAFVHEGTGIYGPRGQRIVPARPGGVLVFTKGGRKVFARSVAGMRGRPFLRDAMEQVTGTL